MKNIILGIFSLLLISSCSKEDSVSIVGSWELNRVVVINANILNQNGYPLIDTIDYENGELMNFFESDSMNVESANGEIEAIHQYEYKNNTLYFEGIEWYEVISINSNNLILGKIVSTELTAPIHFTYYYSKILE